MSCVFRSRYKPIRGRRLACRPESIVVDSRDRCEFEVDSSRRLRESERTAEDASHAAGGVGGGGPGSGSVIRDTMINLFFSIRER